MRKRAVLSCTKLDSNWYVVEKAESVCIREGHSASQSSREAWDCVPELLDNQGALRSLFWPKLGSPNNAGTQVTVELGRANGLL